MLVSTLHRTVRRRSAFLLFTALALVSAPGALAQKHFTDCVARTANNATLIFPKDVAPLDAGDEIAVFTPQGQCAGAAVWHEQPLALTLWGRSASPGGSEAGLATGDSLRFRLWDTSSNTEYNEGNSHVKVALATDQPHLETCLCYRPNAIYVVKHLQAKFTRQASR